MISSQLQIRELQQRHCWTTQRGCVNTVLPRQHRSSLMAVAGKYDKDNLPQGPRSALFRQILPGAQPLLQVMQEVADARRKTVPQVCHATFCHAKGNGHVCAKRHKP